MSADSGFISLGSNHIYNLDTDLFALTTTHQQQNSSTRYGQNVNNNVADAALLQKLNAETQQPSNSSFLSGVTAYAIGAISVAVTNSMMIDQLVPPLIDRGICLSNFIPVSLMQKYRSWMNPFTRMPTLIHNFLIGEKPGNPFFKTGILAPVCEEMEYRFLIQHVLLKKIPEHILNKIAPNYSEMINKWPVQVLRAFTVALLFAIAHGQAQSCESWGGLPQLIGGLLYGLLNEFSNGDIVLTMNLHMIHNMFVMIMG
ncbi:MAG: CPBP family glutamic-type intramembrane protease [Parachlamydiales bacterium]